MEWSWAYSMFVVTFLYLNWNAHSTLKLCCLCTHFYTLNSCVHWCFNSPLIYNWKCGDGYGDGDARAHIHSLCIVWTLAHQTLVLSNKICSKNVVSVIFTEMHCKILMHACHADCVLEYSRQILLTFRTGRFICFEPRHQVITAAGFDPELLHSISYVLSAETNARFAKIWTAAGFTVQWRQDTKKKRQELKYNKQKKGIRNTHAGESHEKRGEKMTTH